jgi:hypothetical protein
MGSVRKRSPREMQSAPQKNYNRISTDVTGQAGSGQEARYQAEAVDYENQVARNSGKNPPVVKINTNPARTTGGVTSTSKTVNKLYRPMGGGLLGGLFGNKQR